MHTFCLARHILFIRHCLLHQSISAMCQHCGHTILTLQLSCCLFALCLHHSAVAVTLTTEKRPWLFQFKFWEWCLLFIYSFMQINESTRFFVLCRVHEIGARCISAKTVQTSTSINMSFLIYSVFMCACTASSASSCDSCAQVATQTNKASVCETSTHTRTQNANAFVILL